MHSPPSDKTIDEFHVHPTSVAQVQPRSSTADEVEWSTALLDCFEDVSTCCYGFWCCCCLSCTVSGKLQKPYCLPLCDICSYIIMALVHLPVVVPPAAFGLRMTMRHRYKLKGSVLNDMTVSMCCAWCSWCQMHRELKHQNKTPNTINIQNVVSAQPAPVTTVKQALCVKQTWSRHTSQIQNLEEVHYSL